MKTVKFVFILFGICLLMSTCNNNTPVRHLPMEGGYNFRDLGGYKTTDGKSVKWGKIFRSDDLANLTENDLAYLSAIPIVSIVDFRSESEMENAPDKLPASVENYCPLSVSPGNMDSGSIMNPSDSISPEQMMEQINILLVSDSAIIAQYKTFFALLQEKENIPLLFHCSAGKDRTGMGAALILFALGVDEETIFEDYLASNNYLEGKYSNMITAYPELTPFFTVKEEYLKSGLNTIKKEYG
ncbi:tyrosine-protein phosphatase, partial [Bacteroidales bacterium OttesenSCG-928-A17]|nr:tyrosine-protein phosphatase [Bacteroidales bacterium OttesenSCG-928-A17]